MSETTEWKLRDGEKYGPDSELLDETGLILAEIFDTSPGNRRAHLIAAAPKLLDVVHGLCIQLASAGVEAKADSLNPIAALHAKALAAHEAATGDGNPFATALAGICADNRAALARGESPSPDAQEVK